MQIDFHHAVTYVVARAAGFFHIPAQTIAYAAQAVDDAVSGSTIVFDNGAMFKRHASAHKMLDYRNLRELGNHLVWLPFHFLPGNGGLTDRRDPGGSFIEKLVCRPDSLVARDMVAACIVDQDRPYALHRLGVSMHVYADTWAHQGFAGVNHDVNRAHDLSDDEHEEHGVKERLKDFFGDIFEKAASGLVGDAFPLGHGAVLSFPDRPYLQWRYKDYKGRPVERDNTATFMEAAQRMCEGMQRYRAKDPQADVPGLPAGYASAIERQLRETTDPDGEKRHQAWLEAIAEGKFPFGRQVIDYVASGPGSWKHAALGAAGDAEDAMIAQMDLTERVEYLFKAGATTKGRFTYDPQFLTSDYKLFHDALQAHRFHVIHELLPRYGICAA